MKELELHKVVEQAVAEAVLFLSDDFLSVYQLLQLFKYCEKLLEEILSIKVFIDPECLH